MQKYSSKETSLNQVPALAKYLGDLEDVTLLDFGCGRFHKFEQFVTERGGIFYGYDKYWKSAEENILALNCCPDVITCANVLNVIFEDEIIEEIVELLASYRVKVLLQVYEGNKSGKGSETTKGYQRHQPAISYLSLLERHFSSVIRKGNIFICENKKIFEQCLSSGRAGRV